MHNKPYRERYKFVPLEQISPDLQHAVIAAEDARFYQHHGFDWHAIQIAAEDDMEGGADSRGFDDYAATGEEPVLRDGAIDRAQGCGGHAGAGGGAGAGQAAHSGALPERGGVGAGDLWRGSGERAYDYGTSARNVEREEGARLAAILPAPLKRRPERMNRYSAIILERMGEMGW